MARHGARQVDPSVNYRASAAGGLLLVAVAAAGTGGCGSRPTSLGGTGGIDAGGDRAAGGAGGTAGAAGAGGRIGSAGMTGAGGALPTDSWQVLEEPISRKVDILFMIDNSQSMLPLQTKLLAS